MEEGTMDRGRANPAGVSRRWLLSASTLVFGTVACARAGSNTGPDAGKAVGQVPPSTVQLWHADDNSAAEGKVVVAWLPVFNAQYPQVKVEYQPRPNGWQDKLTA